MKITKRQLKRIIKEERQRLLNEQGLEETKLAEGTSGMNESNFDLEDHVDTMFFLIRELKRMIDNAAKPGSSSEAKADAIEMAHLLLGETDAMSVLRDEAKIMRALRALA